MPGTRNNMKYVQEIDDQANFRALVVQDLKEFGIKVPKSKKNKVKDEGGGVVCMLYIVPTAKRKNAKLES